MKWLDETVSIEEWGSEELAIPYEHPIRGGMAKYYPDFIVKFPDGVIKVIEVKPKKETSAPEKPKRQTRQYLDRMATWVINQEKWTAARKVCQANNLVFEIWTEEQLAEMGLLHMSPENKKQTLRETAARKKPKMKPVRRATRPRPTRKS